VAAATRAAEAAGTETAAAPRAGPSEEATRGAPPPTAANPAGRPPASGARALAVSRPPGAIEPEEEAPGGIKAEEQEAAAVVTAAVAEEAAARRGEAWRLRRAGAEPRLRPADGVAALPSGAVGESSPPTRWPMPPPSLAAVPDGCSATGGGRLPSGSPN